LRKHNSEAAHEQVLSDRISTGVENRLRNVNHCRNYRTLSRTLNPPSKEEVAPWSANRAAWLFIRDEDSLEDDDKQALGRMKQTDEEVAEAYAWGLRFAGMVRERQHESLLPWLEDVAKSGTSALMDLPMASNRI
jgi:hypothetical protein